MAGCEGRLRPPLCQRKNNFTMLLGLWGRSLRTGMPVRNGRLLEARQRGHR